MRTGDQGVIRFKFKYGVEFIERNSKIMVREGNTKAFGYVTSVYPMNTPPKDLVDNYITNDARVGVFAKSEFAKLGKENKKNANLQPILSN
mmetsp:Transcript_2688/g.4529  ORF Transcript_2688/g.4529 Transcript_2688/m.4529 type:complete len:91 (+) Transcript_2688:1430-1702(+)